jgi:hypothetical protein
MRSSSGCAAIGNGSAANHHTRNQTPRAKTSAVTREAAGILKTEPAPSSAKSPCGELVPAWMHS